MVVFILVILTILVLSLIPAKASNSKRKPYYRTSRSHKVLPWLNPNRRKRRVYRRF